MRSGPSQRRRGLAPAVAVAAAVLSLGLGVGVAFAQPAAPSAPRTEGDPLETMNRGLYAVHRGIDKVLLRPAAKIYLAIAPKLLRDGLHNGLSNLGEPLTVVNDLLQLRLGKAATATTRFLANSTIGIGGLFDVAGRGGLPYHYADFGQTLGRYGVRPGPYVFIPVLGPSTFRDMGGRVVDATVDPVNNVHFHGERTFRVARAVADGLDTRAALDKDIDELDRSATDPYVTLRSAYLQNRQSFISGGRVDVQSLPSFGPEATPQGPPLRPRSEADPVADAQMAMVADTFFGSVR